MVRWGVRPYRDLLRFDGRASLGEARNYILFSVFLTGSALFAIMFLRAQSPAPWQLPAAAAITAFTFAPAPAILVRRTHDSGLPGWPGALVSLGLILVFAIFPATADSVLEGPLSPLNVARILLIIAFSVLMNRPGQPGANRFGPDPRDG